MIDKNFLYNTALEYRAAGLDVIPDHPIDKYPSGINGWQTKNFSVAELQNYITEKGWSIGIRNQEGLDFDNVGSPPAIELFENWKFLVEQLYPGITKKLLIEQTKRGGFHVVWKCKEIGKNQKLASRPPTPDELKNEPKKLSTTLIETRGTGGQFMVSPSPEYILLQGDWRNLTEITPEERIALFRCAKILDKMPVVPVSENSFQKQTGNKERPGDIYDQKNPEEALDVLGEAGWVEVFQKDDTKFLRRPGKDKNISATFGYVAPGIFYNFSANAAPFEPSRAYTPFAVLTLLKYDGDFSRAAKDLVKRYGLTTSSVIISDLSHANDHLTDLSNAEKIAGLFSDKVRFDHKRKRWLIWHEHRWQSDTDGEIGRLAIEAARQQYRDAEKIEDLAERSLISKWSIQSESKIRMDASISIAKNLLPIADNGDNWDADPMLLSCPNGIVDLKTGKLMDGKQEDRITMVTNVEYDPEAQCLRWEQFIDEIFEGNIDLVHYVHKSLGYSLTGYTKEQVAFFCFGAGGNGKSVLFKTVRNLLGDYAYDAPACLFQRNLMSTNTNDVAATEFKRFLVSSETLTTSKLNEQRLKGWTGGDRVTARFLNKEFFSFDPTVKPWLFVNHKPTVEDDSFGFWRRVRLIPFNHKFEGLKADKELPSKLEKEFPGILTWLVEGCLIWQEEGLEPTPEIVSIATQDYRVENDQLADFIATKCIEDKEAKVSSTDLYKNYMFWTAEQGFLASDILNSNKFGRRMGDKFERKHNREGTFYKGLRLITNNDPKNDEKDPKRENVTNLKTQNSHDVTDSDPFSITSSISSSQEKDIENDPESVTQAQSEKISVTKKMLFEEDNVHV